ncbi:hypothetical protein MVEG_05879 [Podila verticillata NRRL 6337]|nr:hypothetical protein MVEG_05879 [Podila verticillata NRRL 6337]
MSFQHSHPQYPASPAPSNASLDSQQDTIPVHLYQSRTPASPNLQYPVHGYQYPHIPPPPPHPHSQFTSLPYAAHLAKHRPNPEDIMHLRSMQPPLAPQSAIPSTSHALQSTPLAPATRATISIAPAPQSAPRLVDTVASTSQSSRLSATPAPQPGVESSTRNTRSFWSMPGMEAFLDWVTEPHNHDRLNKKRPVSGQRAVDLYGEISKFVFERHKVDWDVKHVKYRMINARRKYDAAKALSEITGGGETRDLDSLRKEMLLICPPFDRLDAVWGGTLARDPPPPRETCNRRDEDYFNRESSPEVIETEEEEEEEEDGAVEKPLTNRGQLPAKAPANKRRKANNGLPTSFQDTLEAIRGAFADTGRKNAGDLSGTTGRTVAEISKQEEMLNRRIADFEAEKATWREDITSRREEIAAMREELRQAKVDHRQDVAMFKQEVASFKQEVADFNFQRNQFLTRREEAVCRVVMKDTKEVQLT